MRFGLKRTSEAETNVESKAIQKILDNSSKSVNGEGGGATTVT